MKLKISMEPGERRVFSASRPVDPCSGERCGICWDAMTSDEYVRVSNAVQQANEDETSSVASSSKKSSLTNSLNLTLLMNLTKSIKILRDTKIKQILRRKIMKI